MKDRVNFLTVIRAGDARRNRARQVLMAATALGVGILAVWFGVLQFQVSQVRKENRRLERRVEELKDLHALNATLGRKREQLTGRRDELHGMLRIHSGVRSGSAHWSRMLADLAAALPPGVWLDRLQVGPDTGEENGEGSAAAASPDPLAGLNGRVRVSLSGRTVSQEQLLDFLARVDRDPRWESATLKKTDRDPGGVLKLPDLVRFQILLVPAG